MSDETTGKYAVLYKVEPIPEQRFMNIPKAAKYLGMSQNTLRQYADRGQGIGCRSACPAVPYLTGESQKFVIAITKKLIGFWYNSLFSV